jgi:hypothetical protein
MEMNAYAAALLTVLAAFAVYLVFAQLAHMKRLKQRDQAAAGSDDQPASGNESGSS